MSVIAAALKHMLASNMPHDAILAAVEDMERGLQTDEQAERRRAADRERQRQRRLRISAESADVKDSPRASAAPVEDKTSNSENTQKAEKKETRDALSIEFDEHFWPRYPNKVGKPKARASFNAARRKVSLDVIMAGLERYVASKPPDRAWLNPTSYLNQERWDDQPATVVPFARGSPGARPSAIDHFRNYAGEINGQERDDGSPGGIGHDASGVPIRAIEHHG